MRYARFAVVLLPCAAVLLQSQELRTLEGVRDYEVLQRAPTGVADLKLSGAATGKRINGKEVEARLLLDDRALAKFDWISIGKIQKQKWSAQLADIPAGGPYRLELRVRGAENALIVDNILVGDLWLLAGQSNMEGHGDLVDVQPPMPLVHSFDMEDHWLLAAEPLHTQVSAVDRVHWRVDDKGEPERWSGAKLDAYMSERKKGAGLGLPFAAEMVRLTGVPIGLIPCAHGGTSMEQWSPALKDRGGDSLYGSMLRRFNAAGGKTKGMLWYQGESDANPVAAPLFLNKFEQFVNAVRSDFYELHMPFYYVQIGRHVSNKDVAEWNEVQEAQLRAESELRYAGMIASVDSTLDDPIHISTEGLKRLGRQLAGRACHDLFPEVAQCRDLKPGPRPVSATFNDGIVKVLFSGLNGRLQSQGRISGFSIQDASGQDDPLIYKAVFDPADPAAVLLYVGEKLPANAVLRYGEGKDPYCNVRDSADLSVPAFGPLAIKQNI